GAAARRRTHEPVERRHLRAALSGSPHHRLVPADRRPSHGLGAAKAPDELDLFPDREELLAGRPTRRADTLLFLIESRTAHLVARSRRAMEQFVPDAHHDERALAFFEASSHALDSPLVPPIQDLERHSEQWAPLVAERPQVRAALAHRLGRKYRFTHQDAPGIRRALGLDDPQVRRAYRRLYR